MSPERYSSLESKRRTFIFSLNGVSTRLKIFLNVDKTLHTFYMEYVKKIDSLYIVLLHGQDDDATTILYFDSLPSSEIPLTLSASTPKYKDHCSHYHHQSSVLSSDPEKHNIKDKNNSKIKSLY